MTKAEFIKKIADTTNNELTQKQVTAVLDAMTTVVREVALAEDEVTVPGICHVKTKTVPAKTGTIRLGENKGGKWEKPAHKEATIKIVSSLKKVFE